MNDGARIVIVKVHSWRILMVTSHTMPVSLTVMVCLLVGVTLCQSMKVVHPGRHVCLDTRQVHSPVKQIQSYCQPSYQKQLRMCDVDGTYRLCTSFRVVYKTAYREVFKAAMTSRHVYVCCPGWTQEEPRESGCMKPVCTVKCQNGGKCQNQKCLCQPGWTGVHCESDIDECRQDSVCEHLCNNSPGSFQCRCQNGFQLDQDQKSCKYCLKCQPEYKELVNDYNHVMSRLKDMETNIKVNPKPSLQVQRVQEATAINVKQMQKDIDSHVVDSLRTELKAHISDMHTSLKASLLDDIFSYMKQTVQPDIQDVIIKHLHIKLTAAIKADIVDYVDKQIDGNMSLCRDVLDRDLHTFKAELNSYKGTLRTYSRDMASYRREVEHYKNDLKDEMSKYREEVGRLRIQMEELEVDAPTQDMEFSRLASLSEQIGFLEEKVESCVCGR